MRCWAALGVACVLSAAPGALAEPGDHPPGALSRAETAHQARERSVLLAQALPEAVRLRSMPVLPPLLIASGGLLGASGVVTRRPALVVSGAAALLGGAGFYLMPEQCNYELLVATAQASTGLLYLGMPLDAPHERWQIPVGAGHLALSALWFVNVAYSSHPGATQLRRDLERVRSPEARSKLSAAEVRELERDLYDTQPFVPRWIMGMPLVAGGLLAGVPLFDDDVAGGDKPLFALFSGLTILQGLAYSFAGETPAERYESSLERAGLWIGWAPMPGGVSVVGAFE